MEVFFMREQQADESAAFGEGGGVGGGTNDNLEAMVEVPWVEPVIVALGDSKNGASALKPAHFAELRDSFGWKPERYRAALRTMQPFEVAAGRSGAAFWQSQDKAIIAKEVWSIDYKTLQRVALDYIHHVIHERSCLVLVLGAYQWKRQNIIVMESIRAVDGVPRGQFDVKGLRLESGKRPFELTPESHAKVMNSISVTTAFLERINVVDYSILMVEQEDGKLVVGIIDFLMEYSVRRAWRFAVHYHWKRPFLTGLMNVIRHHCCTCECHFLSPKKYRERIVAAAKRDFVCTSEERDSERMNLV